MNILLWLAALTRSGPHSPLQQRQLMLSGLFVAGCAYRSFYPNVYIKRFTLSQAITSSIVVGRSIATVAEIAFALQLQVALQFWGDRAGLPGVGQLGWVVAALLATAQLCCWFGVATGRYLGELVEESLWTLGLALVLVGTAQVALHGSAWPSPGVLLALIGSSSFVAFMLVHNLPMYVARIRRGDSTAHRGFIEGVRDMAVRRNVSYRWSDWAGEAAWLTPYSRSACG